MCIHETSCNTFWYSVYFQNMVNRNLIVICASEKRWKISASTFLKLSFQEKCADLEDLNWWVPGYRWNLKGELCVTTEKPKYILDNSRRRKPYRLEMAILFFITAWTKFNKFYCDVIQSKYCLRTEECSVYIWFDLKNIWLTPLLII